MDAETRRFTAWLSAASGLVLVAGGFGFAFSIPGAVMVYTGFASLLLAAALALRSPWWLAAALAAAAEVAQLTYMFAVYPG